MHKQPDVEIVGPAAAIRWFEQHPRSLRDPFNVAWLGVYHLWLGQFAEAGTSFDRAKELFERPKGDGTVWVIHTYHELKFVSSWLQGNRREAAATLSEAMASWRRRHITQYGDNGGGVSIGLLLWYAARELRNGELHEEATDYLRRILARKWKTGNWPQPIARLVLGDISPDEFASRVLGVDEVTRIEERPRGTIRIAEYSIFYHPDQLPEVYFYLGVLTRSSRARTKGRALLRRAAGLKPDGLQAVWYLARHISGMKMLWRPEDAVKD